MVGQTAIAHDIVLVSRTGYGRMAGAQESVDALISQVVRASVRPVLVAGSEFKEESEIRKILVAFDGSTHSARALLVAAELDAIVRGCSVGQAFDDGLREAGRRTPARAPPP